MQIFAALTFDFFAGSDWCNQTVKSLVCTVQVDITHDYFSIYAMVLESRYLRLIFKIADFIHTENSVPDAWMDISIIPHTFT